jgi:hypothetical protein
MEGEFAVAVGLDEKLTHPPCIYVCVCVNFKIVLEKVNPEEKLGM